MFKKTPAKELTEANPSVTAFCFARRVCLSVVCLSRVRSRKLGETSAKFRHSYTKSTSESKNMTSDFAPEVAKYPKKPKPPNSPKWDLDN